MFTTSILIFALIAAHAQAFALWVQSIRLTNNRISKSNYGDDITDAVPVFLLSALLFLRRSFLFFSFFLPPFFLRSFCADRYSLHDFVPIKRFRWYQVYQLRRFVPQKRLSGTRGSLKPVLYEENVLDGTDLVYRTEFKPSVSTQFRSGRSSGRRRYVSVLHPEARADMPG